MRKLNTTDISRREISRKSIQAASCHQQVDVGVHRFEAFDWEPHAPHHGAHRTDVQSNIHKLNAVVVVGDGVGVDVILEEGANSIDKVLSRAVQ